MREPTILYEKVPLDVLRIIASLCITLPNNPWFRYVLKSNLKGLQYLYDNKVEYGSFWFIFAINTFNLDVVNWFVDSTECRLNFNKVSDWALRYLHIHSEMERKFVYLLEALKTVDDSRFYWNDHEDSFSEDLSIDIYRFKKTPVVFLLTEQSVFFYSV